MATITISRQYGSGGRKVALRVRELLGYHYFDKSFITRFASEVGLLSGEAADFSEEDYRVKGFFQRVLSFNPAEIIVSPASARSMHLEPSRRDTADSIELEKTLIRAAYARDNMVIVGRGAQVILRHQPHVLHVRVIAPPDIRLQRLQTSEGLSLAEAQREIEERDRASRVYLERFFGVQWDDPYLYHLTINTGLCDLEQAAHLIVTAAQQVIGAAAA